MLTQIHNAVTRDIADPSGVAVRYPAGAIPGRLTLLPCPPPNESGLFAVHFDVRASRDVIVRYGVQTGACVLVPPDGAVVQGCCPGFRPDFRIGGRIGYRQDIHFRFEGDQRTLTAWLKHCTCSFSVMVERSGTLRLRASFPVYVYKNPWLADDVAISCFYQLPLEMLLWRKPGAMYPGDAWLQLVRDRAETRDLAVCPGLDVLDVPPRPRGAQD